MKKKIVGVIAVVAIAAIAGYNVYSSQNDVKLSDLALANVEALASDGERPDIQTCPGGRKECARVLVGSTMHIFYEN